jgi:hypothetical protein
MEHLIKSLPALLRVAASSPAVTEVVCLAAWNHAIGAGLRANAVAIRLDEATLVVAVPDRIWQRQLQTMLGQLRLRTNSLIGQPLIRTIELRIDPKLVAQQNAPTATLAPLSTDDLPLDVLSAAGSITDTGLRRRFLRAAASCLQRIETHADKRS